MAMKFFSEEIKPYVSSIKGPTISLSMRRGQISFSTEASELLKLKTDKSYIAIGYDEENNLLGFKVLSKKEPGTALVEELKVYAIKQSVNVIYAFSLLDKISDIPRDGSYKYLIQEGEGDVFYVDLSKGKKNPKAKSKVKSA
jgi:hypothetical protein